MVEKEYLCVSVNEHYKANFTVGKIYKTNLYGGLTEDRGYECLEIIGTNKLNKYCNPENLFELLNGEIKLLLW